MGTPSLPGAKTADNRPRSRMYMSDRIGDSILIFRCLSMTARFSEGICGDPLVNCEVTT